MKRVPLPKKVMSNICAHTQQQCTCSQRYPTAREHAARCRSLSCCALRVAYPILELEHVVILLIHRSGLQTKLSFAAGNPLPEELRDQRMAGHPFENEETIAAALRLRDARDTESIQV
jgi:hypothetical protein